MIEQLLDKYLVRCTSEQRLVAYRTYREQRGKYWTAEHLARVHWEYLYSLVSLDKTLGLTKHRLVPNRRDQAFETLQSVRVTMCDYLKLSEELVPCENLAEFFSQHEQVAKLRLEYPDAQVFQDAVPDVVVKAYEKTFASELPASCFEAVAQFYDRACTVASEHQLIVFPRASGEACLTVAYVKLKCQEAFARQFWHNSCLAKPQIKFTPKYNLTDFATWVLETRAVSFGKLSRIVPLFSAHCLARLNFCYFLDFIAV